MAINSVWSPVYAWLLGLTLRVVKPSMQWEFPVIHLVNFATFLVTLFCFDYFWRQLTRFRETKVLGYPGGDWTALPNWAWHSLGYLIFIVASLELIAIWSVTPDMLMAALVLTAAGLLIGIQCGNDSLRRFSVLGLVLGVGYLTKAIMLPISLLFILVAFFSANDVRQAFTRSLLALAVFVLVAGPFIVAISVTKGRLTWGDAGSFTYAKHVNGVPFAHWQGDQPPGSGTPEHPTRVIFDSPTIYEFATPVGGTYPVGYDPSYWHEGLQIQVDLRHQLAAIISNGLYYYDLVVRSFSGLIFGLALLSILGKRPVSDPKRFACYWGLVVIASVVFALYGLVETAGRYIGVFTILLWAGLLVNVRLRDTQHNRSMAAATGFLMVLFLFGSIIRFNLAGWQKLGGTRTSSMQVAPATNPPTWPGETAEAMHQLGVQPGDKVGVVGYAFDSYWARLGRFQIVAEMLESQATPFWLADGQEREAAVQAFVGTGIKAIVAENVPAYADMTGWIQVGGSNYYIYLPEVP
jgi:hypothetical protein